MDAIECIEYATSQNVRILSNSWGGGGASDSLKNAIQEAGGKGALFVAAAGNNKANNDQSPSYPGSYGLANIVSVAAIESNGRLASFSNYGAATVHVAAPGVGIYSSTATSDTSYASFSGTSMATPHVAGMAALVVARYPGTDLTSLRNRVLQGAVPTATLAGKVITGGRANAYNALTLLADGILEVNAVAINKPIVGGEKTVFEVSVSDVDKVTAASVTATNTARGINASFRDDGQEPDRVAGDGVYSATIVLPASDGNGALNSIDLVFSVTKSGKTPYQQATTFAYVDPLTNDHFADARMITGTAYTSPATKNTYATLEAGEPKHEFGGGGKSVWWRWTAPRSGRVQVDTRASSFDTVLAVYTGSALNKLALVASNDDVELVTGTYTSLLTFDAVAGSTYWIAVDGVYYSTAGRTTSGTIVMSLLLNSKPVASDAEFTVVEGTPSNLSLSATDADGQELRFSISAPPAHGRAGNPNSVDGVFAYTSKPGFRGRDTLSFTATDGIETSAPAQVRITVLAAADADGDGLPDAWESAYGLNPALNDAALDPDGDGVSNLQEYLGESNPLNPASRPAVIPIVNPIEEAVPLKGTANWGVCRGGNSMRNGLSSEQGPSSPQLAWSAGADSMAGFNLAVGGDVVVTTRMVSSNYIPDDPQANQSRRQQSSKIVAHSLQSGALLWEKKLPVDFPATDGFDNPVGICNGVVYATRGTDEGASYLYALSAANGQILWRSAEAFVAFGYGASAIFAPNGDPILWTSVLGTVRVSARNGATVWWQKRGLFKGSVVFGERVYGLGWVPEKAGYRLRACDLATGALLDQTFLFQPVFSMDSQEAEAFFGPDRTIYFPRSEGNDKVDTLWAIQDTGSDFKVKWAVPLPLRRGYCSFAIGPDRMIYSHSRDNRIIQIDPADGRVLRSSEALSSDRLGTTSLQLAIDSNRILFASNKDTLYSFNADLTLRWSVSVPAVNIAGTRLGDNGTLVVAGSGVGGIKAFRTTRLPQNAKPEAQGQTVSLQEDGSQAVVLAGTDADGSVASYAVVTGPSKGTLGGTAPNLVYTPGANFNGTDSFTFTVTDNWGAVSDAATVTLSVGAVNDAPLFTKGADQSVGLNSGTKTVVGWATGVSAGAPDESGQTLNFIVANSNNSLFAVQPAVSADGTLSFVPASGKSGSATVTVRLRDSSGTANGGADTSAAQTFTVTVADTAASLAYSSGVYPCLKGPGEVVVPVTVRRSLGEPQKAVSAVVMATSNTLQPGDYSLPASPMVLNWPAGDTSDRTFPVIIRPGRTIAEGGESLRLTLQNLVGASVGEIGTATVALTPRNPGFLNFASTVLERAKPESGDLTVNIPVRRVQGGTGAVSADVVLAGGMARAGDFTISNPARLEWADGDTADKTFAVVFKEAASVPAAGKTIQFRLANLSGGAMEGGMSFTTLVVRGATLPGTLNFSAATYAAVKASTGDTLVPVTVNRGLGGNGAVSVQVVSTGGTASGISDFSLPSNPVTLNWADEELGPKTFNVVLKEAAEIASGGETVLLKLQTVVGGAQLGQVGACRVTFNASDTAAPVLVLESPANRATVKGESVLFKGTATDASGVTRVEVTLNSEEPQKAVLMHSANGNTFGWMTTLVPEQGLNTVRVQAFDGLGNASAMLTRQFTFLYSRPALVGTFDGRLEAATDEASLAAEESQEVVQRFVQSRGEGLLTASVTATGAFTGKLTTGRTTVSFKGVLRRDGVAWFDSKTDSLEVASGRGAGRVVLGILSLRVQETEDLPRLVGELASDTAKFGTVSAEKFVYSAARVLPTGMQRVPVEILDPASENGRYTALFEARVDEGLETNSGLARMQFPQSSGYAKVTVASRGVVSLAGRLADGTAVSYSNRLSPSGAVPVYVPLYAGRGFLAGTPAFDESQPETDLAGAQMRWVRPSGLPVPYETGWSAGITVDLVGSKYVPVTKPTRAVPVPANPYTVFGPELPVTALELDAVPDFVGLRMEIAGGGLPAGTTHDGQLSAVNLLKVTTPGAAGLKLVFAPGDGGFKGSFTHPKGNRVQAFAGVVLQKTKRAGGGFMFQPTRGATEPAAVGSVEVTVP